MDLFVTALNSGSNGNCYYIGNKEEAVLVDVGISCREVERRMNRLKLPLDKVKALFISHEHSDHCRGIKILSKKHNLPIYITEGTLQRTDLNSENPLINLITSNQPVMIGNLSVTAFPKFHDANDPQSFVIKYHDLCVGVFTDIGISCEQVIKHFKCCHAIFLESNYDDHMLQTGNYPYHLKRRITNGRGHLSNKQALELFLEHKPDFMSHVFLSHISKENNDLSLVYNLFQSHAEDVKVVLTSRTTEIDVFRISSQKETREQNFFSLEAEIDFLYGRPGSQLGLAF